MLHTKPMLFTVGQSVLSLLSMNANVRCYVEVLQSRVERASPNTATLVDMSTSDRDTITCALGLQSPKFQRPAGRQLAYGRPQGTRARPSPIANWRAWPARKKRPTARWKDPSLGTPFRRRQPGPSLHDPFSHIPDFPPPSSARLCRTPLMGRVVN